MSLLEKVPGPPELWDPKPDDSVEGIVTRRDLFDGEHGSFEVLTIRRNDGSLVEVSCGRAALKEMLELDDPQPGDQIAIIYYGPAEGRRKHRYSWFVEHAKDKPPPLNDAEAPSNWS